MIQENKICNLYVFQVMEHCTVGVFLQITACVTLIAVTYGLSYPENDPAANIVRDACTWCIEDSDDEACAMCNSGELQTSADIDKRSGGFYRRQRSSCNCCFLSRFTNSICCTDCSSGLTADGLSKRSDESMLYHPLLRGSGFPKKSNTYNPLLRGSINKRFMRMYNPLLRGGSNGLYTYDSSSNSEYIKKSQNFYNPLLRGFKKRSNGGFTTQGFMLNPLLRGTYNKKSNYYNPFLRGGFQMPNDDTLA